MHNQINIKYLLKKKEKKYRYVIKMMLSLYNFLLQIPINCLIIYIFTFLQLKQRVGKGDETKDEVFDEFVFNFNKQQVMKRIYNTLIKIK